MSHSRQQPVCSAHAKPRQLLVLGSTGSIGVNTLDVAARHPDKFQVFGLVAGSNIARLREQVLQFRPRCIVVCNAQAFQQWDAQGMTQALQNEGVPPFEVLQQADLPAVCALSEIDCVMAAIVGSAGLVPTLAAIQAGKTVFLANKESLVLAGRFMLQAAQRSGACLMPVDSEHNAIYQCLPASFQAGEYQAQGIRRLVLTASGGPFNRMPLGELKSVTPEQAVAHPNWVMGKKISVDSATMANKSLELFEAYWLFGCPAHSLDVLIHPQSIVHSMVEYLDGSVLAQMGMPDMRTPIAHVMGFPQRMESGSPRLDLTQLGALEFEAPDLQRFPMLGLAFEALKQPSVLAPVFNAANEEAVQAFLAGKMGYLDIYRTVQNAMDSFAGATVQCLESAFALDAQVRQHARTHLHAKGGASLC
ncbi:MAG: 1-deoxy-D-xylulose-5-phosphate reductoisomerase [Limnobacter sp.]|nr:1-deoxy-D-xylulose-5-phosphate reductoisomerase [Limnobacter sp.]